MTFEPVLNELNQQMKLLEQERIIINAKEQKLKAAIDILQNSTVPLALPSHATEEPAIMSKSVTAEVMKIAQIGAPFRVADVIGTSTTPNSTVRSAIQFLMDKGTLKHISRGLYVLSETKTRTFGSSRPEVTAQKVVTKKANTTCAICNMQFKSRSGLASHAYNRHNSETW